MGQSKFIQDLLSNIVDSKLLDYDGEFGHVVREYTIRLPNGSVYMGSICDDAYRGIGKNENQRCIDHIWQVAYDIQRSAYIREQASSDTVHTLA